MKVPAWIFVATTVGLALGLALLFRNLFPISVPTKPRIITQYDTVRVIDTAWITKLRRDTIKVNVTERVVVSVPETIYAAPRVRGITAFHAGERVGDSTIAGGFTLEPLDSGYTRRDWLVQFYTMGPVRSLVVDSSAPRITFYPPPPKPCGIWCKLGYTGIGTTIGASAGLAACAVLK